MKKLITLFAGLLFFSVLCGPASAEHWVGTWATSQQLTETYNNPPAPGLTNNTLRQVIRTSIAGNTLRVQFSNAYGNGPLTINAASIGLSAGGSGISAGSARSLTFAGVQSVTLPAGATVYSDPVNFTVPALTKLAVSAYFGQVPSNVTGHPGSRTTSYIQQNNAVNQNSFANATTTDHWYVLSAIDLYVADNYGAVVVMGDSITDGRGSTTNANNRWTDILAERLQANPATQHIAVLNHGIGGNAVLAGGLGPTARTRFDHDVIGQSGVRWAIILEGVNDIGPSSGDVSSGLISAYQEFITKAHAANINIFGGTILPFRGNGYYSAAHEQARQTVNQWLRNNSSYDAVIDFDAVMRNPNAPDTLVAAYDSGDGLHPGGAGYQAMGGAVDLGLFTGASTGGNPPPAATALTVRARGESGAERIDVYVNNQYVSTLNLTTAMADYGVNTNLRGPVTLEYGNDSSGRDVQVDLIIADGAVFEAEDQQQNSAVWDSGCGNGAYSEWMHCNGKIVFPDAFNVASETDILVRARGVDGSEVMDVSVGDTLVGSYRLSTVMASYTASTTLSGEVKVIFSNDASGRDVQIDYIQVDGATRQAEEQSTNTGVWSGSCGGAGYSEWLHCSGYISFGNL